MRRSALLEVDEEFNNANALSNANKGEIHKTFSMNSNWPYPSWSAYAAYTPLTDSNFQSAVNLWFSDETNATVTYGHIRDWNTSAVTDMSQAFKDRANFNEDLGNWDVSSVTTMAFIFHGSSAFNQPIGDWNVSSVTSLHGAFKNASSFNQPIGNWNVSSVRNLPGSFLGASAFNQPIGDWNVSSASTMQGAFLGASAFQNLQLAVDIRPQAPRYVGICFCCPRWGWCEQVNKNAGWASQGAEGSPVRLRSPPPDPREATLPPPSSRGGGVLLFNPDLPPSWGSVHLPSD